ncbi:MAG: hypothetical protein VX633_00820, partial [Verrucomicrobiota bacterium]|nr:hypothetical protein [Verrucomicrobiota bacterium]
MKREGIRILGRETEGPSSPSGHACAISPPQKPMLFMKNNPSESQNNLDEKIFGSFGHMEDRPG